MSLDDSEEKIELLKEIRDEVRGWRCEVREPWTGLSGLLRTTDRLVATMERRFDGIERALADFAEQVHLTVHYTKVIAKQQGIDLESK